MPSQKEKSLKQRMLRAGGWTVAGHGLAQVLRLCSNLIMTRLLAPEMFGIMAIATMVTMILGMLSDIGLRQNIIQSKRGDDPVFLDSAWVIQIIRGFGLWLLAVLLAVALHLLNGAGMLPAASVYASPQLPIVIAASALSAIILGFQSTKMAVADRRFDQKRLVQIELVSQITALGVMIVLGAATRSIWALVAGGLVASFATSVLSHVWMAGPANQFRLDKTALRELIGFGKWIFVSSAMTVLSTAGDRLLLGGFVDAELLGIYAVAALIARSVENALQKVFRNVLLPAFSEINRADPKMLRDAYYKLRVPADLLLLFLAGFIFATGQLLIDILYDPRYSRAGGVLEVLCLSLFVTRYGLAHQIYLSVGTTKYLAVINVVRSVSMYVVTPVLFSFFGFAGAIWGIALHALPTVPLVYFFNHKLGLIDIRRELLVLPALLIGYLCGSGLVLLRG